MVGAGAAEGSMDASNMLKPMLARGELHTIGATTLDEYRKYIEKDAALERRFQPVHGQRADRRGHDQHPARPARALRDSPRREDQGLRRWSPPPSCRNRYIADRFLPDKAIDLVDEAASKLRMEIDSMPAELDELERRIMQLEIEREALRKEKDKASKERLGRLEKELADLKEERGRARRALAAGEGGDPAGRASSRRSSKRVRLEIERAQRAGDYAKASELQYGRCARSSRSRIRERGGAAGRSCRRASGC